MIRSFMLIIPLGLALIPETPFQDVTFENALALAKHDKKVVLIDFFTTWCIPCKKLDKSTWSNEDVRKWLLEKTVPLKVDAEKEGDLAARFGVHAYPTIVFVNPDGTKLDQIVGYVKPDVFLSVAGDALAGKTSVVRAREKLEHARTELAGHETEPAARQSLGDELVNAGMYEEALAEYLWCFDNGRKDPGYRAIRASFLIGRIKSLSEGYPAAGKALLERRDAAERRLAAGSDSVDDVEDVVSINRGRQTPQDSVAAFDRIKTAVALSSRVRAAFADDIFSPLVASQRYQEAVSLFDDPKEYATWRIGTLQLMPKPDKNDGEKRAALESAQAFMKAHIISDCSEMYEALVALSKLDEASAVADRLIQFDASGNTYASLVNAAFKARAPEVAKALGRRGLSALPAEEKRKVERALHDGGSQK